MASIGPEIPPDSSRAALSVRVGVKSSAVGDSEMCMVSAGTESQAHWSPFAPPASGCPCTELG